MLTVGSEFSGVGLLDYGLHLAGLRHAWFCERDEWRRSILAKRFPGARILDDVRHVGGHLPRVEVIAGGFPCKGASTAGKRTGFDHPETVLWREMARAVGELRPRYVLVENVAHILALHDGAVWGEVLGDLAALGYDTVWDCLPAAAVGAPHLRDRVFCVATDADESRADAYAAASGSRSSVGERAGAASDPGRDGVREQPEPEPGGGGEAFAGRAGEAAADAGGGGARHGEGEPVERGGARKHAVGTGRDEALRRSEGRDLSRGVAVEWGAYEPAIRRWEAVHGPAPLPLVRRVDDRGAARVERSRLSALGDGVQVQVGRIAGEYIVELERERLT